MRLFKVVVVGSICLLAGSVVVNASTLEEKRNEWSFAFAFSDTDDVGTFSEYDFTWSWIFSGGYHELGVSVSAFENDFDSPLLTDDDGDIIGPIYQWNWTPKFEQATGFLSAGVGAVGGDLGDFFDTAVFVGIGAKVFVGDSAAIILSLQRNELQGDDFVQDQESTSLSVGISIFTHNR